jgi:putative membrane protein
MRYWPDHMYSVGWGGWVLGILLTIAFWGLLITAVVWLIGSLRRPARRVFPGGAGGPAGSGWAGWPAGGAVVPPAEQILAERYARGEIGEEEYRSRLAILRGGAGVPPGPPSPPRE